jgi:two-component system OmpR family sensor kinase
VSIRLRVAVIFAIALAVAFSLGSWLLVSQLRAVMLRSLDAGLAAQLAQAGKLFQGTESGGRAHPPGLPPGDYIAQLIDSTGRVRASSEDTGRTPLLTDSGLRRARRATIALTATVDGDPERLMAAAFTGRPGWVTVVGTSLESFDDTVAAVVSRLAIGGTVLVLVAGLGAYGLARAALAPVERLRREAAALSERDTSLRLAVPATKDEVAALAGTMNDLLRRLHEALARQRAFVADASHELRTPFAVLSAELELAAKPGRSQRELAEAVSSASEEAARLRRLTEDLLLLATSDEDRLAPRTEPVDLCALLTQAADLATERTATTSVTCRVDAPARLTARVDPSQIRRAVDNLIDNALRFAPDGTDVVVSARAEAQGVIIEVADMGPGFPADYLPHAFERFSRPDTGRGRAQGGAGLGLSIVRAIAQAHGGGVTIRNQASGGAIVRMDLPA